MSLRPATAADSAAVIDLVRECWTQYPGVVFDLEGELPELKTFGDYYRALGGEAWVAERDGAAAGCIAVAPEDAAGAWMLHKLNVRPALRRAGAATALVGQAEAFARAQGALRMVLWSDTRFTESHAFYKSLGYAQTGQTRELGDRSNTVEYGFVKDL